MVYNLKLCNILRHGLITLRLVDSISRQQWSLFRHVTWGKTTATGLSRHILLHNYLLTAELEVFWGRLWSVIGIFMTFNSNVHTSLRCLLETLSFSMYRCILNLDLHLIRLRHSMVRRCKYNYRVYFRASACIHKKWRFGKDDIQNVIS